MNLLRTFSLAVEPSVWRWTAPSVVELPDVPTAEPTDSPSRLEDVLVTEVQKLLLEEFLINDPNGDIRVNITGPAAIPEPEPCSRASEHT